MRYSIIILYNTKDDIDDWKLQPDAVKNNPGASTYRDIIYSSKGAKTKLIKDGYKPVREINGLQYYKQGRNYHCLLVPETHSLFNFHIVANEIYYHNYTGMPTNGLDEAEPILIRKYVVPLLKPGMKI